MKHIFLCTLLLLFLAATAEAQSPKKKTQKADNKKEMTTKKEAASSASQISHTSSYPALRPLNAAADRFTVEDPILRSFNEKTKGEDVRMGSSGIAGMPRRAYGFANGKILLYSTGSTSSGGNTGNATVGTGSGLGSIGSSGPLMGINGKSPYAGSAMWGNARNMTITRGDSSVRLPVKKE